MTCDRCYQHVYDANEHGVGLCPYEPRQLDIVVRQDSIPGGMVIEHGLCHDDGTPRTFYSRSELREACAVKDLVPWTDVYTEDRTKDARVHADWLQSSEAKKARAMRVEMREARSRAQARR
jgi:hypothetical protein